MELNQRPLSWLVGDLLSTGPAAESSCSLSQTRQGQTSKEEADPSSERKKRQAAELVSFNCLGNNVEWYQCAKDELQPFGV